MATSLEDILAAPLAVEFGGRRVLLRPLTLSDLGTYHLNFLHGGPLDNQKIAFLTWLSVRRDQPWATYEDIRRRLGKKGGIEIARAALTERNPGLIVPVDGSDEDEGGDETVSETNFAQLVANLALQVHWTPGQIAELSPLQAEKILAYFASGGKRSMTFGSKEEAEAYAKTNSEKNAKKRESA